MKSIKEKAEEYSFIRQGVGSSGIQYRDFSINKKYGFIAGANYVLEQIEEIIKWDKDPHVIEALKEKICRLKQ